MPPLNEILSLRTRVGLSLGAAALLAALGAGLLLPSDPIDPPLPPPAPAAETMAPAETAAAVLPAKKTENRPSPRRRRKRGRRPAKTDPRP
jgi:hypothetical protein